MAVLSILVSRLCCIVPFIAIISGLTGGATLFSFLDPWRPLFLTVSASILAFGFYQEYKPKNLDKMRPCCREKAEGKSKRNRRFLWATTIISALLFSFPFYSHLFINARASQTTNTKQLKTIQLFVEGMSCQGCANNIMLTLSQTEGIIKDTVVFKTSTAAVTFDQARITPEQIVTAIENIGFNAMSKQHF